MSLPKTITHLLPTGAIILWGGADMPNGFLLCNGASVSRSDYPDLAEALGETGATFTLPDYRDRVPQGAGTVSPNVEVAAGLPEIAGAITVDSNADTSGQFLCDCTLHWNGALYQLETREQANINQTSNIWESAPNGINFAASKSNSIYSASDTVQPAALTSHFLIKA